MEIEGKRFVVFGGAGFVGSHVVDRLLAEGAAEVVVFDNLVRGKRDNLAGVAGDARLRFVEGTITDPAAVQKVVQGVDGVFLLAALWLYECLHEPRKAVEVNVLGTFNVIEACKKAGVGRVVFSSSASVYGDAVEVPMTEDHPFNNRTMYGATKIAGEQFFRAFHEMHGLEYVGLRYMNVYGPRMDDRGTYVSVIMKVMDKIRSGERPVIFGDGSQSYDFVHVEDVARANVLAMQATTTDRFYNVGTGVRTTINELVHTLLEEMGSDIEPEHRPQEQSFVNHRVGSTEQSTKELGFTAQIGLQAGLASVVRWYAGQQDAIAASQSERSD